MTANIYDSLIQFDASGAHTPMLATSWEFASDTELVMQLREGVLFHDGETMMAEDVQFSLERIRDSSASAHLVGTLGHVEVLGDYEVKLVFTEPFAPILSQLTTVPIFSKAAVEAKGDNFGIEPVGAGPYMLSEWAQNDYITLEAFADYWNGEAMTKYLTYRVIPENAQRTIALENGEIDIAVDITATDIETVATRDDIVVESLQAPTIQYLGMHTEKTPFDNQDVRHAIAHAINKQALVDAIFGETASIANSPCGPGLFGDTDDYTVFEYDVDKAKQLLADAGYADGFDTTLWCRDNAQNIEIATIVAADLMQVGINAEIVMMEWGAYLERSGAGEHEMYLLGWGNSTGDANNSIYGLFSSNNLGISGNRAWYKNDRVDELLGLQRTDTDPDNRLDYFEEILQTVIEEQPVVPLYHPNEMLMRRDAVEGLNMQSVGNHRYHTVTVMQ